jgi:hypothetical protein
LQVRANVKKAGLRKTGNLGREKRQGAAGRGKPGDDVGWVGEAVPRPVLAWGGQSGNQLGRTEYVGYFNFVIRKRALSVCLLYFVTCMVWLSERVLCVTAQLQTPLSKQKQNGGRTGALSS